MTVRSGQSGRSDAGRLHWSTDQDVAVAEALGRARDGIPTVLFVDGAPGTGKSAFVRRVAAEADGFVVLAIFGGADAHRPYAAIAGLGITDTPLDPALTPAQGARLLRAGLDAEYPGATVLLAVDDLADLDTESSDALARLAEQDWNGRLLITTATRSAGDRSLAPWRRLLLDDDRTIHLRLTGLEEAAAARVVAAEWPDAGASISARLWRHTGGNPLLLKALLREHTLEELRDTGELPAPRDLVRSFADRIDHLHPATGAFLRAVVILGERWCSLRVVGRVAGVSDVREPLEELEQQGLVMTRITSGQSEVRVRSGVIGQAVVDAIAPAVRRRLHESAATAVDSPVERLHHRFLASERYDEPLAEELADLGWSLHLGRRFRESGRVQRWSSSVTADPALRERRLLDGLFDTAMARDLDAVGRDLDSLSAAHDEGRRAVVEALTMILQHRWSRAATVLGAVSGETLSATDRLTRYRLHTLLAWSLVVTGASADRVRAELTLAEPDVVADPRMSGYFGFATALANGIGSRAAPAHVSGGLDLEDAWQGAAAAVVGMPDVAIRHLRPFVDQVDAGTIAMGDGEFHALLGYARWLRGDWSEARTVIRAGSRARYGTTHPMVAAVLPLAELTTADPTTLAELRRRAREALHNAPWPPAISMAVTAEFLCLQLTGDLAAQRAYGDLIGTQLPPPGWPGEPAPLWLLTRGAMHAVAGKVAAAEASADRLAAGRQHLHWRAAGVDWLRGLAAEAAGDLNGAAQLLRAASAAGMADLVLHGVVLTQDLARIEGATGNLAAAEAARGLANDALARIDDTGTLSSTPRDPLAPLSDREREVVDLLSQGLSYAQIAGELFVSRSTVAFHLSNVYAKTATGSRHELIALVRRG